MPHILAVSIGGFLNNPICILVRRIRHHDRYFFSKPKINIPASPNTVSAISPPAAPHADFLLLKIFSSEGPGKKVVFLQYSTVQICSCGSDPLSEPSIHIHGENLITSTFIMPGGDEPTAGEYFLLLLLLSSILKTDCD